MPNSYEHSYQHDLDNVIDASDAVLAIGTEKVDTTTLKDRALSNDATIHGAMRASGYFDGGRIYDGDDDYLEVSDSPELDGFSNMACSFLINPSSQGLTRAFLSKYTIASGAKSYAIRSTDTSGEIDIIVSSDGETYSIVESSGFSLQNDEWTHVYVRFVAGEIYFYKNGVFVSNGTTTGHASIFAGSSDLYIGRYITRYYDGVLNNVHIYDFDVSVNEPQSSFNTLARLPLYSHNFERYPNSDTSLTSVFPYTSGIITSGSFNKTDGLKCTSAGTIVFSNSFVFDGSEYITLIIGGVEYSGTTTVTESTITATIAQGSNDITIDMGTNDVLEEVRVQFRSEV